MTGRLDAVIQQLREEEAELRAQREELEQRLKQIDVDAKRVQSALVALGDKSATKGGGKRPANKLAPSKEQIAEIVAEVLQLNEALETDTLRTKVESRLKSKGLSRMSFATRFQEALSDERFVESPAGWKLIREQNALVIEPAQVHQNV